MKLYTKKAGQSLIELLVAFGLTAILLPALVTAVVAASEGRAQSEQRTEATNLLKEAEETVRTLRESNWQQVETSGTYHPVVSGSNWALAPGAENINGFTRTIEIQDATRDASGNIATTGLSDPSTKKITSTVSWTTPRNSQVDSTTYITRYLGNANLQETTQAQFNPGTKVNTEVTNNSGGEVQLIQTSADSTYGNKFGTTATSNIGNMTSINHKTSIRFTAQESKTVNAVRVYLHAENGNSPQYRYGIQTNNPTGNIPTGTWVGNFGTATSTTAGWQTINLGTPAALASGTVYHLVVEPTGSPLNPNGSRNIGIRRSAPQNLIYPKTNNADTQANTLFKTSAAGAWAVQNFQPIYELDFSDGTYEGNPYEANTEISIFGNNWYGEKFTVSGVNKTASSVSFCVRKNNNPPNDLSVEIRNSANSTIYSGVLSTSAAAPTSYTCPSTWQVHTFSSPITLTAGSTYRIFLRTTGGNNPNSYRVQRIATTNSTNYNSITYDGTNSVFTNATSPGTTWTDTDSYDLANYFFTVSGGATYNSTGTFESQTIDAGTQVAFNNLNWSSTSPPATSLVFQLAINNDASTWNFFGPDGTPSTFFTASSAIPLDKLNGRYIRYKAFFTSDGTSTPTLGEINLNYSP